MEWLKYKATSPSCVPALTFPKALNVGRIKRVLVIRNENFLACRESLSEDALTPGLMLLSCKREACTCDEIQGRF